MPLLIQVFRKGQNEPLALQDVDMEVRNHFQYHKDQETKFICSWPSTLTYRLAFKPMDEVLSDLRADGLVTVAEVCEYISDNYDIRVWR